MHILGKEKTVSVAMYIFQSNMNTVVMLELGMVLAIQFGILWVVHAVWLHAVVALLYWPSGSIRTFFQPLLLYHYIPKGHSKNAVVTLYRMMPLRGMSRVWGQVNNKELPEWCRRPLLSLYVWMFGCKIEEAAIEDLTYYKNLGEFFRRALKPGMRPIDVEHPLVMPSDGKVLHFGKLTDGVIEQVKGVTYSLKGFFGPCFKNIYLNDNNNNNNSNTTSVEQIKHRLQVAEENTQHIPDNIYYTELMENPDNELYHCVIYLAPGDYHRFHSPVNWTINLRRHFPGDLLSVNPSIARWVKGLFNLNERAVYFGKWQHGFFSMTAVGATNVGSIRTYFDRGLFTNAHRQQYNKDILYYDKVFTEGIPINKGELFGEFNLGSTIVLVFEAPKNFDFTDIQENKKVMVGQPLGRVQREEHHDILVTVH